MSEQLGSTTAMPQQPVFAVSSQFSSQHFRQHLRYQPYLYLERTNQMSAGHRIPAPTGPAVIDDDAALYREQTAAVPLDIQSYREQIFGTPYTPPKHEETTDM